MFQRIRKMLFNPNISIEDEGKIEARLKTEANNYNFDNHDIIAIRVFRRLRLRHAQLRAEWKSTSILPSGGFSYRAGITRNICLVWQ